MARTVRRPTRICSGELWSTHTTSPWPASRSAAKKNSRSSSSDSDLGRTAFQAAYVSPKLRSSPFSTRNSAWCSTCGWPYSSAWSSRPVTLAKSGPPSPQRSAAARRERSSKPWKCTATSPSARRIASPGSKLAPAAIENVPYWPGSRTITASTTGIGRSSRASSRCSCAPAAVRRAMIVRHSRSSTVSRAMWRGASRASQCSMNASRSIVSSRPNSRASSTQLPVAQPLEFP